MSNANHIRRLAERGHTVAELMLVVTVVGIAAAVALPALATNDEQTLDDVVAAASTATRFSRAGPERTASPYGVRIGSDR